MTMTDGERKNYIHIILCEEVGYNTDHEKELSWSTVVFYMQGWHGEKVVKELLIFAVWPCNKLAVSKTTLMAHGVVEGLRKGQ